MEAPNIRKNVEYYHAPPFNDDIGHMQSNYEFTRE